MSESEIVVALAALTESGRESVIYRARELVRYRARALACQREALANEPDRIVEAMPPAELASLSPANREAVFCMVYAQPDAQPSATACDPSEPCVVMIASRAAVLSHGGGNVINVIKSICEGSGIGPGEAKVAFENGHLSGTMFRATATEEARRINEAWGARRSGEAGWFPATVVAVK